MELKGKIVNFLGDSITQGCGVTDQSNRYDCVLARECGFAKSNNYGIGGTRIAYQHHVSVDCPEFDLYFCGRARRMAPNADLIIVFGGTNDYGHGDAEFGTDADRSADTFCGAMHTLMKNLKIDFPNSMIVLMTPSRRCGEDKPTAPGKHILVDYVEAMKSIAKQYDIPVMDTFNTLGIDPNNDEQRVKYTADGLHLNDEGHKVLAGKVKAFLETL